MSVCFYSFYELTGEKYTYVDSPYTQIKRVSCQGLQEHHDSYAKASHLYSTHLSEIQRIWTPRMITGDQCCKGHSLLATGQLRLMMPLKGILACCSEIFALRNSSFDLERKRMAHQCFCDRHACGKKCIAKNSKAQGKLCRKAQSLRE